MSVVVLGSINMDLVVRTPRWPAAGETITGQAFFEAPGGKGANQAVAAARLGAPTRMIGRVGGDAFGATLRDGLRGAGVDVDGVTVDPETTTGIALIAVDGAGQNRIILVPGANGRVGAAELAALDRALVDARVLLLQLEVPLDVVIAAARAARARGVPVVLDPAPAPPGGLPPELYPLVSVLTPNETEAAALVGFPLRDDAAISAAAGILHARGAAHVIITLGARGLYWTDGADAGFLPASAVQAVDTVGAGDAFNAGLAVALAEGRPFAAALAWGLAAGALSVTRTGAQPALPDRAAVERLLATMDTGRAGNG